MNINNDHTGSVSHFDLQRTSGARQAASAPPSNSPPGGRASLQDSISLSINNEIVQQALNAGAAARSSRIEELKQLVATNRYPVDAAAVSRALVQAHLRGD